MSRRESVKTEQPPESKDDAGAKRPSTINNRNKGGDSFFITIIHLKQSSGGRLREYRHFFQLISTGTEKKRSGFSDLTRIKEEGRENSVQ